MTIKITRRTNTDRQKFFNGTIKEGFNALVTSDGATVTLSIEKVGGGDLTLQFSDGLTLFDTTPTATITLTAGADNSATENFIYILQSNKTLTKSTSDFPTTEHIRIGYFLVPSAGFVQTNGVYINQNWNEELDDPSNNMGDLAHISEKLRRLNASYFSGVDGNGTDNYLTPTGGNTELKSTSGIVYQKHKQTYPAVDTSTGDVVLVKNWSGDSFHDLTNLYDIVSDSTGATIGNNKYFNLILWGAVNKSGEYSPMIINLPSGFYNTQSGAEADASSFDDFTIPREFNRESSTGFLVARITIQMKTGGGTWVVSSTTDLRGQIPTTATGGVSSIVTQFPDNTFLIFDESDNTKEVVFDVGTNVPTATTNIYQFPSAAGILALTSQTDGTIDHTADILNIGTNTHAEIDTAITNSVAHIADNTQAHSDYLINNGNDSTSGTLSMVGLTLTPSESVIKYGNAGSTDTLEFQGQGSFISAGVKFSNSAHSNTMSLNLSGSQASWVTGNTLVFASTAGDMRFNAVTAGKKILFNSPTIEITGDLTQRTNDVHKFGTTNTDLQISSDGTNGIIDVETALRIGNITTNYMEFSSTGVMKPVGSANYTSSDGSAGITQTETTVNTFDITIKNGLVTSFVKNS